MHHTNSRHLYSRNRYPTAQPRANDRFISSHPLRLSTEGHWQESSRSSQLLQQLDPDMRIVSPSSQPSTGSGSSTADSQAQPPTSHQDLHLPTSLPLRNAETPTLQHTPHHRDPVPHPRQPAEQPIITPGPTLTSVTQPMARGDDLPPGFELKFNSHGLPFYVDHNTRTTHWTLPSSATAPHNPAPTQAVAREDYFPLGFEIRFNSHGQPYYVDHNTRTTHWTLPSSATAAHNPAPTQAAVREEDLPPGFEMRFNSYGHPYYVDHNTRTTRWTLPSAPSSSTIASRNTGPTQAMS